MTSGNFTIQFTIANRAKKVNYEKSSKNSETAFKKFTFLKAKFTQEMKMASS